MKVLIKLGGTILDSEDSRNELARQLTAVSREHLLAVVHGGGKQVTRFLEERGIESRFINGLRVSDQRVVDAVTKVLAGTVNKQLVGAVIRHGALAVGLSGLDGMLTVAKPFDPELGFVGRPQNTDGRLLDLLVEAGYLPVIACVAGDGAGAVYNVNADQMAVSCAIGFQADLLVFLTDVAGVKGNDGSVFSSLTPSGCRALMLEGVAVGGMHAKLESALDALEARIPEVVIAHGREPDICRRLLSGETVGTRMACERALAR